MISTKKLAWLCAMLVLSACQAAPQLPNPLPTLVPTLLPRQITRPSETPSPPPTSTPLPTVAPVIRIESGDQALFFGDYDSARQEYEAALNDSTEEALKAAALWGLGRTELADGRYQQAVAALTTLTETYPESTYSARAYFLLGRTYDGLAQYQQAAEAYETYMDRVPGVLDGYVQEYRGDALYELEDYTGAQNAYRAALGSARLDDGVDLQIKAATARAEFGDYAGALALYDQIFATSTDDYIRAQMDYRAGNAHVELGQLEEAYARYLHAVENYPLSYYSYLSLVELIDANIAVDDFDRGLVDYFAGQYDVALVYFDRYIDANPDNDGSAHYYRALTLRDLRRTQEAIDELDYFIEAHSGHERWADAWSEKAFLEWASLGDYQAGAATLLEYVSTVPDSFLAPSMLVDAGRIIERDDRLEEAAQTWERVADEYPGSEHAPLALFWAGIARFRLSDFEGALATFQRSLLLSSQPGDRARNYLWIGKTQHQLGEAESARESWQQGQAVDPTGYYSLRARDHLLGQAPFESPPTTDLDPDLAKERKDAEVWVRITFELPPDTDLTGPGTLAQDARFIRGTELWELGMYDQARVEFEALREAVNADPADSFRLANHLLDIGLYRTGIFAARQVLTLAGHESQAASLTAPPYFGHSRYGLYYHDLIITEAQRYGLDPLLLFSVVRQESLFEGFVRSTAGAHGLMQVIPATGEQIARELNWPPAYDSEDLYRPIVSVRFGSYYLDKNRDLFDGNLYAGLAAYNAGPGNAIVWNELAGNDPDLLLEIIRFEETRNYIRFIYEIFNTYRMLYGAST
ncbi:MAG TPA: tetratricopeptide repeat protein [Anaerolineales bacterium]|nr:tetratricopeptide repeat protein [Anaerolineales bacterium]